MRISRLGAGWHYRPLNDILDEELQHKAASSLYDDWMHVYMVDGVYARDCRR